MIIIFLKNTYILIEGLLLSSNKRFIYYFFQKKKKRFIYYLFKTLFSPIRVTQLDRIKLWKKSINLKSSVMKTFRKEKEKKEKVWKCVRDFLSWTEDMRIGTSRHEN